MKWGTPGEVKVSFHNTGRSSIIILDQYILDINL